MNSKPPLRSVISRTTILILGAFLIGLTANDVLGHGEGGFKLYVYISAVIGVLSFIGLDALARRREFKRTSQKLEAAVERMEQRVERHVSE